MESRDFWIGAPQVSVIMCMVKNPKGTEECRVKSVSPPLVQGLANCSLPLSACFSFLIKFYCNSCSCWFKYYLSTAVLKLQHQRWIIITETSWPIRLNIWSFKKKFANLCFIHPGSFLGTSTITVCWDLAVNNCVYTFYPYLPPLPFAYIRLYTYFHST